MNRTTRQKMTNAIDVVGLGCFGAGAYTLSLTVGLFATGAACLLLSWRMTRRAPR